MRTSAKLAKRMRQVFFFPEEILMRKHLGANLQRWWLPPLRGLTYEVPLLLLIYRAPPRPSVKVQNYYCVAVVVCLVILSILL